MKYYNLSHTNTQGTWPSVAAKNASSSTAVDGTGLVADTLDDNWGFHQAIMNAVGSTYLPNGSAETYSASQLFAGLQAMPGCPGMVFQWHGNDLPGSASFPNLRLLLLDGSGILCSNYPELVAACYIGDANNGDSNYKAYYKANDAAGTARSTSGNYFILPDYSGCVPRNLDPSNTHDPELNRHLGTVQKDALQDHYHDSLIDVSGGNTWSNQGYNLSAGTATVRGIAVVGDNFRTGLVHSTYKKNTTETRGTNISTQFVIRY